MRYREITENTNPNFKRWFGNSLVVGQNGEPLVVYHGSNSHAYVDGEIDIFHTLPASGRGAAFFTSSKELAREYGEKVYAVYLRIENPLIVHGDGKRWTALDAQTRIGGNVTDQLRKEHHDKAVKLARILSDPDLCELGIDPITIEPESRISDNHTTLDGHTLDLISDEGGWGIETDDVVKRARKLGYDGVIFKDIVDSPTHDRHLYRNTPSDVYAVFRAHQIKSVNNAGSYSLDDPDIRS